MASIYKTSQSRFYFARFSDGSGSGKRISKSTKTESKREATREAKRIAAEFESAARKLVAKEAVDSEIPAYPTTWFTCFTARVNAAGFQ